MVNILKDENPLHDAMLFAFHHNGLSCLVMTLSMRRHTLPPAEDENESKRGTRMVESLDQ